MLLFFIFNYYLVIIRNLFLHSVTLTFCMRNVAYDGLSSHVSSCCLAYYMNMCKMDKKTALLWCVLQYDVINGVLFGKSCNTGSKETA
jgi:hypothetical protein